MMGAVISLLVVMVISLLVTRLASTALILTGMSHEAACFQARSALAGVGFTTREAETVVNHPVRRRIIMLLMLTGSIGTPTVIATVVVSLLTTARAGHWWQPALLLVGGLAVLIVFVRSQWVSRHMNAWLLWGLKRWTTLDVRDYVSLLQLQNGYAVTEMLVKHNDWLDRKTLQEAALSREGILVLGIQYADGTYHGTPRAADVIEAGNTLVLYGPIDRMKELDERSSTFGESAHQQAIMEQAVQTLKQEVSPFIKNMSQS